MERKYQNEILMVCHQEAKDLYEIGAITEEEMREFDEACLVQEFQPVEEAVASY